MLIYVFDVESRDLEKDFHYYQSCLSSIAENSKDAKVHTPTAVWRVRGELAPLLATCLAGEAGAADRVVGAVISFFPGSLGLGLAVPTTGRMLSCMSVSGSLA